MTTGAGVRGNAVIEFALVLPFLLLIVFGITEFGRALMTVNLLNSAAREGARIAAVGSDSSTVVTRVQSVLTAASITTAAGDITVVHPGGSDIITVTAETNFKVLSAKVLPPAMRGTIRLRGVSVMRFEG